MSCRPMAMDPVTNTFRRCCMSYNHCVRPCQRQFQECQVLLSLMVRKGRVRTRRSWCRRRGGWGGGRKDSIGMATGFFFLGTNVNGIQNPRMVVASKATSEEASLAFGEYLAASAYLEDSRRGGGEVPSAPGSEYVPSDLDLATLYPQFLALALLAVSLIYFLFILSPTAQVKYDVTKNEDERTRVKDILSSEEDTKSSVERALYKAWLKPLPRPRGDQTGDKRDRDDQEQV
uniref:Transmembrane protein n=1 Tax=Pycnococcus provasolii TaxID=41880 RepID=A0A7S2F289_9CHLO|mmetsp:Transcript_12132/g.27533  ORF Transcript_12132/g.27533 Transcript_12132/m.27533 type:complete len:232 (+) Transcript_12132:30-725(+)